MRFISFLVVLLFSLSAEAQKAGLKAEVKLSPAGGFTATTPDVTGEVTKEEDGYKATNVKVNLKNIKTGIELRDKHTQKHLETEKFPEATLVTAIGKKEKGKAKIKFHGEEKEVEGTYKVLNDKFLQANFVIKLSDFAITGIRYMGVGVKDEVQVELIVPLKK